MKSAASDTTTVRPAESAAHSNLTLSEAWDAAWAAYQKALKDQDEAHAGTRQATVDFGPDRDKCYPHVWDQPSVRPFVEKERAAAKRAHAAMGAMLATPADNWLALGRKFNVVCERLDNILTGLDPRDFHYTEKGFPGTRAAGRAHHLALSAHLGMVRADHLSAIPQQIAKMAKKAGIGDLTNPTVLTDLASSTDGAARGLVSVYGDALRLAAAGATSPPPAGEPPAQVGVRGSEPIGPRSIEAEEPSFLEGLLVESSRIDCLAADLPNCTHQGEIDRLDEASAIVFREFVNAPLTNATDAATKLKFVKKGFEAGTHTADPELTDQIIAFLEGDPACPARSIVRQIADTFDVEDRHPGSSSDPEMTAVCDRRTELEAKLASVVATSREGALGQIAVAHDYVIMASGAPVEEDRKFYGDMAHRLIISAMNALGGDCHQRVLEAYVGNSIELMNRRSGEPPVLIGREAIREASNHGRHPDADLLACVEAYRRAASLRDTIIGHAKGAEPKGEDRTRYDDLGAEMERLFLHTKGMRAKTPEGLRAKAHLALYWQATADFEGYAHPANIAIRSLIADIVDLPKVDMTAHEYDAWTQAHGWNLDLGEDVLTDPRSRAPAKADAA